MKIFTKLMILLLIIATLIPINALATINTSKNDYVIHLDNGSYITVETTIINTRAVSTKSASRTYTYHSNSGEEQWKATLTGTFSYNGSTSSCTSSNCNVSIANTNWYVISKTTDKSGNSATAELTMGRKLLGIKVDEESLSMRITCDANGNLS